MSLSGANSYMGENPKINIFNSSLVNAPPDAENGELNLFDDSDFLADAIFKEVNASTEMTDNIVLIKDNDSKELQLIKDSVENTHVFAHKTGENSQTKNITQTQTEPRTNSLATENFSKYTHTTPQKDLKAINVSEIIINGEEKNNIQPSIKINNNFIKNIDMSKVHLIKANHAKKEFKIVHHEKIHLTILKNDPNVFFVSANGIPIMTAEQKELHGENLALYSFSKKNTSSLNLENFRKNFNQDNIFLCSNDQFTILNNKLMKKTTDTKEKKDEKHVNSNDKESQILEKSDTSVKSSTVSTIDLIKNSIAGIFTSSTRKTDSAKEEQAIQKRDQKKFREKKEMLEKETNTRIIEGIHRKVQENNKPKH